MIICDVIGNDYVLHFLSLEYFYETFEIELNEEKTDFLEILTNEKVTWLLKNENRETMKSWIFSELDEIFSREKWFIKKDCFIVCNNW